MPELRSDNPSFVLHGIDDVRIENVGLASLLCP